MAFDGLASKLQNIFKKLGNKGKLTEKEVKEALREVKLALLEADVNYTVVKKFVNQVSERAVGSEVLESLTPAQQVIKIVNEELTKLMGGSAAKLDYGSKKPSVFLLSGLQGAGKTTMAGKLAAYLKKHQSKDTLLVACDIYRPAAIEQLKVVGERAGVKVFERGQSDPVETAKLAIEYAERSFIDVVIIDTAGRLHIDEAMMDEIAAVKQATNPSEVLLVVDAMTGQDAVNVAKSFHEKLGLTGVILTKLDGDTRGGAALSVREVTGQPIKFSGTGEKLTDIEVFHPDRMASRILGMGDMLSLIEKAEQAFDEKKALELTNKIRKDEFTLDDFLEQFEQVKNMGSLEELVGMIPGLKADKLKDAQVDTKAIGRMEAIIKSMTPAERAKPDMLNASRKRRVANGSGTTVQEVNRLLNQFESTRQMMRKLTGGRIKKKGKKGFFGF
ncbi:MAG: signal recognition particle protein [Clostridia bacterium]|nr:signal recognition particle protein [Clostridia bacterium]MBR5714854.1 signal recognition particle protein [Clostridia bacterium]MBR5717942.1 signal recognition particle protein [Clostridia bacterium]